MTCFRCGKRRVGLNGLTYNHSFNGKHALYACVDEKACQKRVEANLRRSIPTQEDLKRR